jgi:hypothetical protein
MYWYENRAGFFLLLAALAYTGCWHALWIGGLASTDRRVAPKALLFENVICDKQGMRTDVPPPAEMWPREIFEFSLTVSLKTMTSYATMISFTFRTAK